MGNSNIIIIFLSCIMAIIIFGKILLWPIRKILKLVINTLVGGILIAVINYMRFSV